MKLILLLLLFGGWFGLLLVTVSSALVNDQVVEADQTDSSSAKNRRNRRLPEGSSSSSLPSPTHHWSFEDGTANDNVGGMIGTIIQGDDNNNAIVFDTVHRTHGTASLRFNDGGGKVILNDARLKDAFTNYTVSLWFKVDAIMATAAGFRYLYEEGGVATGFAIRIVNTRVEAVVREGRASPIPKVASTTSTIITAGHWHHVVATYTNGIISVYLDGLPGQSRETGYGSLAAHNQAASFGAGGISHAQTALSLVGNIDDVKIWDGISLSPADVSALFWSGVEQRRPNILLIVADDLNFDSLGFMGGVAPDVTPHIDRLAGESHVLTRTHAAESVCQPSRQAMLSGQYPPNYGSVGFNPMANGTKTVVTNLRDAGYLTATFHKYWHMRPITSFPWHLTEETTVIPGRIGARRIGRAPTLLAAATRAAIAMADAAHRPFFVVVNSADSHRPFPGDAWNDTSEMVEPPSRLYTPAEVTLPAPIPDLAASRVDFARYASSVRRLDDTVGRCLAVLNETGTADNTIVLFVSDNGMPMPFGKFDTYRDSLRGPLIVRWPGVLMPHVDDTSLVSLTDVAPTLLAMVGATSLGEDIDGRSLLPLMRHETNVTWRTVVVGTRYEDIYYAQYIDNQPDPVQVRADLRRIGWVDAGGVHEVGTMRRTQHKRGITDGIYHYIYNHFLFDHTTNVTSPLSNNSNVSAVPYPGGMIPDAMAAAAAAGDVAMADRLAFYLYRAPHELYHIGNDPGSLHNLADVPSFAPHRQRLQRALLEWMVETNDPVTADYASLVAQQSVPP